MCGLFGWYKYKDDSEKKGRIFKGLGRKNQSRGTDSFGITYLASDDKFRTIKFLGAFSEWYDVTKVSLIKEIVDSPIVLAHTRMRSKGEVNKRNIHPFIIGDYACAHNGTISNSLELMKKNEVYFANGETDSEEAFAYLVEHNLEIEHMEKLSGSYAFSILNMKTRALTLVADRVASLHYTFGKDGVLWTSEDAVCGALANQVGAKEYFFIKSKVVTWKMEDKIKGGGKVEDVDKYVNTTVEPAVTSNYNWEGGYGGGLYNQGIWENNHGVVTRRYKSKTVFDKSQGKLIETDI